MFSPSKHHHHCFRGHVFIHADNDVVKRLDIVVVVIVLVVFILLVLVVVGVGDVEDQLENEDDGGESGQDRADCASLIAPAVKDKKTLILVD